MANNRNLMYKKNYTHIKNIPLLSQAFFAEKKNNLKQADVTPSSKTEEEEAILKVDMYSIRYLLRT